MALKTALNNISLTVKPGEIVAIMGRNGAGKSTLLTSMVGIRELDTGSILVARQDPRQLKGKALISLVGFVPQEI